MCKPKVFVKSPATVKIYDSDGRLFMQGKITICDEFKIDPDDGEIFENCINKGRGQKNEE